MRVALPSALTGLLTLLLAGAALASSPYAIWLAEMARAVERGQADMVAHGQAAPAFARVWGRGHLPDMVDTEVPEAERTVWRGRLTALAAALPDPALGRLLADPALAPNIAAAAPLADRLADNVRAGSDMAVVVAVAEGGASAEIAFYSQIFRAGLTLGRPTEPQRVETLLAVARHLAEGRAALFGELDWQRDLAAWYGTPGVPLEVHGGQELTSLLNAWLAGDEAGAARHGRVALEAAERKGEGLRAVLIQHLGAQAAERAGQAAEGRTIRIQVLQAVRPLGNPALTGAILAGILAVSQGEALVPFADEILALGPEVLGLAWAHETLEKVLARLDAAAQKSPSPSAATRLLDTVVSLSASISAPDVRLGHIRNAVANRALRGLDEEIPDLVQAAEAAAAGHPELAGALKALHKVGLRARLALGDVAPIERLAQERSQETHLLIGQLRLAQGRAAAAFAHANAGLRRLRGLPPQHPDQQERGPLHELAAAALADAGYDPKARLAYARRPVPSPAHRGCVFSQEGQGVQALAVLEKTNDSAGLTCLVALHLAAGRLPEAAAALNRLRGSAQLDPALQWRTLALAAEVALQGGKVLEGAGLARQAIQGWMDLGAERPASGYTAALHQPAMPVSGHDLLARLPDLLEAAALADPGGAAAHHRAALAAALLAHRLAATPERSPLPGPVEAAARAPFWRLASLRERLVSPLLEASDRPRLHTRMTRAVDDARAARARFEKEDPAHAAWVQPQWLDQVAAPDEVRLVYHFGPTRGHLWVVVQGVDVRHYDLPGAEAVATLLAPAKAILAGKPFDSKLLIAPVAVLLPFLPELAPALAGRDLRVLSHGPLNDFPLEALVLEDRTDGGPPVFLGAQYGVRRSFFLAPTPALALPQGLGILGAQTPENQALAAAAGGKGVLSTAQLSDALVVHRRVVATEPVSDWLGLAVGEGGADAVVFTQAPVDPVGVAALRHRGVRSVIFGVGAHPRDAAFLASLVARLSAGEPPADALQLLQQAAMRTADPATWHPARWAQWLIFEG